jgi:dihydroorotase
MCIELSCPGGNLPPGGPADGIVVDLDLPWVLDREELKSKCKSSRFDEACLQGRLFRTSWCGERKVFIQPCR